MDFYQMLNMVHAGGAVMLFSLAMVSITIAVLIAVKPAADRANAGLVKKADTIGLIENITAIVVALTGLIAMLMGSWPLSQLWLWMSLVIVVFYALTNNYVTKPARQVVAQGGSAIKAGMQVLLEVAQFLLLLVAFALMLIKPSF
jgi:uncharacterized membrane protein